MPLLMTTKQFRELLRNGALFLPQFFYQEELPISDECEAANSMKEARERMDSHNEPLSALRFIEYPIDFSLFESVFE